ncbi:MAG: DUF6122 family protein [Proteobacteria bacterium]|nr:DUF6122 family protein [Pseudomonadota bacterium]
MIHLLLHVLVPLTIALVIYRENWRQAFAAMLLGMLIDVDHLLADPIYDPERCSIGFHPLHTIIPIGIYIALFAHEKTRLPGLGLCVHIALDLIDCSEQVCSS